MNLKDKELSWTGVPDVAFKIETLCYKPEGSGFDSR
jgi:hypothetical protein